MIQSPLKLICHEHEASAGAGLTARYPEAAPGANPPKIMSVVPETLDCAEHAKAGVDTDTAKRHATASLHPVRGDLAVFRCKPPERGWP